MPSHLSTLGLPVADEAEFWELARRVGPLATGVPTHDGTYFHWHDSSGAELWLQVGGDDQFLGMSPHFAGDSRVRVRLTGRVTPPDGSPLDGGFHAWADPGDDDPESGAYPFVFDAPDFLRFTPLGLPAEAVVQVAAFAHELEVFADEAEFAAAQDESDGPKLSSRFFAPSGLFTPEGADQDLPGARAVFTGVVLASDDRVNGLTARRFVWLLVQTYGGTYDVVAEAALLDGPVAVGAVVSGSFWLSGRVVG